VFVGDDTDRGAIDGMESSFIVVVDDTRRPNVNPARIGLLVLDGFVVVGTVVLVLVLVGVSSSFCGRNVVRAGVNKGGVDDDLLLGSSIVDAVDDVPPPLESFVVSYARKKFRGVILPGVVVAEEEELLPRAEGDDEMMTGRLDLIAVNDKGDAVGSRAAGEEEEDPSL